MVLRFVLYPSRNPQYTLIALALTALLSGKQSLYAQTFDSGSTGADGALTLTTPGTYDFSPSNPALFPTPVDPEGDNIYHFTTITIGTGVTLRLSARFVNAPVFWLASGTVQIDGIIDLNGELGQTLQEIIESGSPFPSVPGAGGYPGGVAPFGGSPAQPGGGPGGGGVSGNSNTGGGAGHARTGDGSLGGAAYGNPFLVPLLGGSGGGGGVNSTGGAGGGALLIASSVSITVNGTVMADGAPNSFGNGGGGSGGAIRLVAPTIGGTGIIHALGNPTSAGNGGSAGRIRLEAFQRNFTGSTDPTGVVASPFGLFLPTTVSAPSSIRAVKINGIDVPANPTGSFEVPDVTLNQSVAVTVNIEAHNIPPGTVAQLYIFSENGPAQVIDSNPLAGTLAMSTATASVVLPPGFSRGFVRATWTNQ